MEFFKLLLGTPANPAIKYDLEEIKYGKTLYFGK